MYFSFIIPVYNAEKTIARCLESIQRQSFADFEVIIIDDGSRDNSLAICSKYAKKDKRFLVLHQENSSASAARNRGLKSAKGQYLCFVDSDDFISPDYLSCLYEETVREHVDAVFFGYHSVNREGRILKSYQPPTGLDGIALLAALSERDMFGYTWIKCFASEIVGEIQFPEDLPIFEDEVFACTVLERARAVKALPKQLYYYTCEGENMLTRQVFQDYCFFSDQVFTSWENLMCDVPEGEAFLQKKANSFVGRCRYYGFERNVERRMFFESLVSTRFFRIHTNWTALDRKIERGNWLGVEAAFLAYKAKLKLTK